jgi:Protein of unknown function (DUF2716)
MDDHVKVEPNVLESVIESLAICAELPAVAQELGGETVMALAADLNACLASDRKADLSKRAQDPWRWLGGSHLERFRERLLLQLGVRHMTWGQPVEPASRDRPIEQLIAEGLAIAEAESRSTIGDVPLKYVESWLRLPAPSVTYDLDAWLGEPASGASYRILSDELKLAIVAAARERTTAEEWMYAVDEPEGADRCFRFWPHLAHERMTWEVSPIPDGDDQVLVSRDFAWGMYSTWSFDDSVDWALSVFGRPFIEAFEGLQPQALSRVIRIDGEPV